MSRKYKFHNPDGVYFITFAVEGWVDAFTRNEYKNILVDSLVHCQKNKGFELFACCIMTNHVHLIARAGDYVYRRAIDYAQLWSLHHRKFLQNLQKRE
jgi:REP element-mobilizing transposase RayT